MTQLDILAAQQYQQQMIQHLSLLQGYPAGPYNTYSQPQQPLAHTEDPTLSSRERFVDSPKFFKLDFTSTEINPHPA